ncbi:MAG: methylenetetrahydrofolate--tRNA-(uracil(54)-C(5))-methyltransferase (FADH(2)-oxidizing) TrmFO, partial [Alphaproteobacteria bacterium]|nr:methylenetetrahydrofolate--tRNA-(uracil(54)-C(5))-methyltransferase (FADH(2)-oxidizing) TrmFO [Alphaproteobacteria bacterium]
MKQTVHIVGAGLAGSEAAWQLAQREIKVVLYEMRPQKLSPAHKTQYCAELVCSNSLRSDDANCSAIGLLHEEMRRAGSLIMQCADETKVPAGGALAVDRDGFAQLVTQKLKQHPLIEIKNEEITSLPNEGNWIVASGPLTSEDLIKAILKETGNQSLNFYDAIAPVIYKESIDFSKAWYQSRYD